MHTSSDVRAITIADMDAVYAQPECLQWVETRLSALSRYDVEADKWKW